MDITNSQAKTFLRCPKQYEYKFVQLLTTRREGLPLKRGSWLHDLLEAYYSGGDWQARNDELAEDFMKMFEEEREMYGDLPSICRDIMKAYLWWWKDEEENWKVIETEKKFEVELPSGHNFVFKVDLIIEDEFGRWLVEHKSHKTIPNDTYRFIDIQTARYFWGLNELGYELDGLIWNYIRTKQPTKPPQLKSGGISMAKKYDTELFTFLRALKEYGLNPRDYSDKVKALRAHSTYFRRERVPKPKKVVDTLVWEIDTLATQIERGFAPVRAIERSCAFSCSFLDLCMTELYGGDADQVRRLQYRKAKKTDYYGLEGLVED